MLLTGWPPWQDQDIVVFHGTTDQHVPQLMKKINVRRGELLKDFGQGFYSTTRKDLADDWANVKSQRRGGNPVVIEITISRDALAALDILFFVRADPAADDYWAFVGYCRTNLTDHNRKSSGWYDVVAGPIAGTWKKKSPIRDSDQVSFHTSAGAGVLNQSQKRVLP